MAGPSDISADELKVFMQEAEGLLELLDEDIVRLEQQEESDDLLQEIFRAAHTLKGSSGMLGTTFTARRPVYTSCQVASAGSRSGKSNSP